MKDPRVGMVLAGRYEIEDVLAEGGMATVYVARHRVVNRACAIKILSSSLVKNRVVQERFRREAKATQKLTHPNIVEILDHGETDDGLPYLVMELLKGETLAELIARGPMKLEQAMPVALQIGRALARAHDFGVIHRDLKPENVFLCEREGSALVAKLLDFGIARSMHEARLTAVGNVFGTPQYMAPERITSIDAGPSADLYSLGVMLFEMLTGRLPFVSDDVGVLLAQHMKKTPPTLREAGIDVPAELEALLMSLMAKVAEKRPVDAHALCKQLSSIGVVAGIAIPLESPSTESKEASNPLRPASIDQWAQRTLIFEQMLTKAYGQSPPIEARKLLTTIQRKVREIRNLHANAIQEQRKLSSLETKLRESRQRFGHAVEGLGLDASQARVRARMAEEKAVAAAKKTAIARRRAEDLHPEIVSWEGRSAFKEPYEQLAAAYRKAADAIDQWYAVRREDLAAAAEAKKLTSVVTDLEYQIGELRSGLSQMEKLTEQERETIELRSTEIGQNVDEMEQDILSLATQFCAPLRKLSAVADLFRQLENHAQ